MSHEIIYQYRMFSVQPQAAGTPDRRFIWAVEMGSNNLIRHSDNKPARNWTVLGVGSHDEVLRQAVSLSGGCEGGSIKPRGKDTTPEAFIGKVRRLLRDASQVVDDSLGGWWTPLAKLPAGDTQRLEHARALGAKVTIERSYGEDWAHCLFAHDLPAYFEFVSAHHLDVSGWRLAEVHGLRET